MSKDRYIIRELRVGDRREAELFADMWNRSDAGWPGGWTGGIPWTAERVLQEFMTRHCHADWVVEYRGEIVGYVSLEADPSQPMRGYIGLLNARTDHHGKGVGRRLLLRSIERAIQDGLEQIDLGTWPGNLKAVPLYKKTGFFWAPETSAHMQNFIPAIVRMPLVKDFFAQHDWYEVQERDLAVAEDIEYWHRQRIYHYRFAADGRRIEVLVDRQAEMPTAVETDELAVAAWVGAEDLPALQERTLHYEFRNKTGRPISVSVLARGEAGVPVSVEESFELSGRRRLAIPFRLPADMERKRPGEPSHRVLSTVTVDGLPIRLGTAVKMHQPVDIAYGDQGLPAGKWTEVRIRLRNRLPFQVRGTLWIGSPPEVERDREKLSFRIARGGWTGVSLRVRATRPGAFPLEMCANFSKQTATRLAEGETPSLPPRGRVRIAWLRAFAPGAFVVSHDTEDRVVTIESDRMLVSFRRVRGYLRVRDKALARELAGMQMPQVGPPYGQFQPVPKIYEAETRSVGGVVHLITRQQYERYPGLTLERTVTVAPGLLDIRHQLINAANRPLKLHVRTSVWGQLGAGKFTLPDGEGLLQHQRAGWEDWPRYGELRRKADEFTESWAAVEDEGAVIGMVWQGASQVQLYGGGGGELTYGSLTVPAGGATELQSLYLVAGTGDHRTVRAVWATYVHPKPLISFEERRPPARKVIRGGLSQVPALLTGRARRMTVELTSEQQRALDGEAELTLPRIVTLTDGSRRLRFPVRRLAQGRPARRQVVLRPAAEGPTAGVGELRVSTQRDTHQFPAPVIIVRSGRSKLNVRTAGDTVSVDTGCLQFQVSAEHGGSIVSLKSRGRELLRSSYPEPGPYAYMNPWYGGLAAGVGSSWDRRVQAVRRSIEPVSVVGATGLRWQGAQVTTIQTHRDWRWLRYQVRYLSTAGSNLLAVLVRVNNRTSTAMSTNLRVGLWPCKGTVTAHLERDGQRHCYAPDQYGYGAEGKDWLAFACGRGRMLAAAADRQSGWRFELENHGDGLFSARATQGVELTQERRSAASILWLAACRSLEEAHAYRFLKELKELP